MLLRRIDNKDYDQLNFTFAYESKGLLKGTNTAPENGGSKWEVNPEELWI